ncbi:MAG: hypothetical protein IOD11_20655 [Rhodocyclaceae bacterium]|nr:hypothetical protein [Rhodocyclaceae bacterium]MCA3097501.1 hypothetical protein [Rhodocyclaceae bacterium]MCA3120487.1 hypothetical protein [Rhodocyclaceae bacterium]
MEITNLHRAACIAVEGALHDLVLDDIIYEIVETHEPVENFRPVDVMSGKAAGREYTTEFGTVVVRKNVKRAHSRKSETMYLMRDEQRDLTLVGWGN